MSHWWPEEHSSTSTYKHFICILRLKYNCNMPAGSYANLRSWKKVLGHFGISGAFSNSQRSNPYLHPKNNVGRVYPEFFMSFNFVLGGGRENYKKISKRMHCFKREPRIWILQHRPKDFCLNPGFRGKKSVFFFPFFLRFLGILETSRWSHGIIMTLETIFSI